MRVRAWASEPEPEIRPSPNPNPNLASLSLRSGLGLESRLGLESFADRSGSGVQNITMSITVGTLFYLNFSLALRASRIAAGEDTTWQRGGLEGKEEAWRGTGTRRSRERKDKLGNGKGRSDVRDWIRGRWEWGFDIEEGRREGTEEESGWRTAHGRGIGGTIWREGMGVYREGGADRSVWGALVGLGCVWCQVCVCVHV